MRKWEFDNAAGFRTTVAAILVAGLLAEASHAAVPALSVDVAASDPLADLLVLAAVSTGTTNSVVQNIQSVTGECKRYDPVYRIDCLAQGLKEVSSRLPHGEYDKARAVLSKAASRLSSLASRNADPSAASLEAAPNANPRFKAKRRYRAVKKEALAAVMKEAQAIIDEAVTELLRSYENSDRRHVHYQKIANATGSTKVLMRS